MEDGKGGNKPQNGGFHCHGRWLCLVYRGASSKMVVFTTKLDPVNPNPKKTINKKKKKSKKGKTTKKEKEQKEQKNIENNVIPITLCGSQALYWLKNQKIPASARAAMAAGVLIVQPLLLLGFKSLHWRIHAFTVCSIPWSCCSPGTSCGLPETCLMNISNCPSACCLLSAA